MPEPRTHSSIGLRLEEGIGRPLPWPLAIALVVATSAGGLFVYARTAHGQYPVGDWLAWPLLTIWGYTALCNLAWFSSGSWVVRRGLGLRELPTLEGAVLGTAVGAVVFTELMYLAGALGLYGPWCSLGLALGLSAAGAPELRRWWRRWREESAAAAPASVSVLLLWALGGALTLLLYLGALTPDSVNYDAAWCHLTAPQDYARAGRMVAFPGDYNKNVPQLATLLRTWVFSVPGLPHPALRWMLALHQEFSLVLWTLAGVAAATRFMVKDQTLRGSWVAFYLFPAIFVYDNNLGGALDHVAAFFSLPGLVAAGRLLQEPRWQRAVPLAVCMAGGFLAKYQALYWILPLLGVMGCGWGVALYRLRRSPVSLARKRRALGWLPLWIGGAFALLVMPHFLRAWVFYNNPVYPFAQDLFPGTRPQVEGAAYLFSHMFVDQNWVPQGTWLRRLGHAVKLAFTFSLYPHYSFAKDLPVFGSLFTLLLPALLFVRERRHVLLGASVGLGALVLWGLTYNVDRNLQVFLPILVATTAALLVGILRLGRFARLAIAPLVIFQAIWGADALFFSSQGRLEDALELITSGYRGQAKTRFDGYRPSYVAVGKALPPDAKVLLHMSHSSLGVDRELVLDWAGFQGLISYADVHNAREVHELYLRHGISHLLYAPAERFDASIQGEVVFQAFVRGLGPPMLTTGSLRLHRLPEASPPVEPPYTVLTLDLVGYGSGVFPIERLNTMEHVLETQHQYAAPEAPAPTDAAGLDALDVDAVVIGAAAKPNPAQAAFLRRGFSQVVRIPNRYTVYLRSQPHRRRVEREGPGPRIVSASELQ